MKKIFPSVILFLTILLNNIYGQDKNNHENYIGINVLSLQKIYENYITEDYKLCIPSGVAFKKDFHQFISRFSLNYNKTKTETKSTGSDSMYGGKYYSMYLIGIGAQKNHSFKNICLYYGMDVFSNLTVNKFDIEGGIDGKGYHEKWHHVWIGVSPIVGIQYIITPRISIATETSYNIALRLLNTDENSYRTVKGFQHYINPINAFTVGFHF